MIYRNGMWDLPKGKQEANEDIRNTALREVEEECGIRDLELKELICITNHTYHLNGNFILKRTYWYKMLYTKPTELIPQIEENISKATWISKCSLPIHLKDTYPSIIEVFKRLSKVSDNNVLK
jgi:8-oxo-dGTP pyrophosphatase MutT (NUDIX family)